MPVGFTIIRPPNLIAFLFHRIQTASPGADARAIRANEKLWQRVQPRVAHGLCWQRRDRPLDDGLALLRGSAVIDSAEAVSAHLMAAMVGDHPVEDDIALLVIRRTR